MLIGWTCVVGLLALGVATFPFPALMSRAYGAPVDDPAGLTLIRATALRDLALGIALAASLVRDGDVAILLGIVAGVSLVDLAMVVRLRGWIPQLVVHAGGAVLGVVGAVTV